MKAQVSESSGFEGIGSFLEVAAIDELGSEA